MESTAPQPFDIFEVFSRYSDIMSKSQLSREKARLTEFSKSLESSSQSGGTIFDEIVKLMSSLDLSGNSHQFNLLYDFVFFICRGDGQKNLTVNRAIAGWRLVLSGRFRLLDQWCNFVEMHQRNSISEDTWQQLLAFSQCVNEDLEGYDPNDAWPILIDNFAQHMYRINKSNGQHGSTEDFTSADGDRQSGISETFSRLNLHSGSRRKSKYLEVSKRSDYDYLVRPKRIKQTSFTANLGCLDSDLSVSMSNGTLDNQDGTSKHSAHNSIHTSACAVGKKMFKTSAGSISLVLRQQGIFGIEARDNTQEESAMLRNRRMQKKPRLCVFCFNKQLYAMLVDDQNKKKTLLQKLIQGDPPCTNAKAAKKVGEELIKACKDLNISDISS